jgi:hypothetical protein
VERDGPPPLRFAQQVAGDLARLAGKNSAINRGNLSASAAECPPGTNLILLTPSALEHPWENAHDPVVGGDVVSHRVDPAGAEERPVGGVMPAVSRVGIAAS